MAFVIERTARLRKDAIEYIPEGIDPEIGIPACGNKRGKYERTSFNRDWEYSATQLLSQPENLRIPGVLYAVVSSFNTAQRYQGTRDNPLTDEQPGRFHHESHTENASQARLAELKGYKHPVQFNPNTKRYFYVSYFADDVQGLMAQAAKVTAEALDFAYGRQAGDNFLWATLPSLQAAGEHDDLRAIYSGLGLPVTNPRNRNGSFYFPTYGWRDGVGAYVGDDGRELQAPYILLPNACHYVKGLQDRAAIAERLGFPGQARNLLLRAEYAQEQLEKIFWSEKLGTYAPAFDKNGRMEFINCDPVDGIFTGTFRPDREELAIERLFAEDTMTRYGVRTRSTESPQYTEVGHKAYQNGPPWGHRNTLLTSGLIRKGDFEKAETLLGYTENYIEDHGFRELAVVTKEDQDVRFYEENGLPAACDLQSWFLYGYLGVSAWALRHLRVNPPLAEPQEIAA